MNAIEFCFIGFHEVSFVMFRVSGISLDSIELIWTSCEFLAGGRFFAIVAGNSLTGNNFRIVFVPRFG